MSNQPDLFTAQACDHLPVARRKFVNGRLICGRCGKVLR